MFKCMECGRKFRTTKAAERAADKGCPGCGGVDIDLDTDEPLPPLEKQSRPTSPVSGSDHSAA